MKINTLFRLWVQECYKNITEEEDSNPLPVLRDKFPHVDLNYRLLRECAHPTRVEALAVEISEKAPDIGGAEVNRLMARLRVAVGRDSKGRLLDFDEYFPVVSCKGKGLIFVKRIVQVAHRPTPQPPPAIHPPHVAHATHTPHR